MKKSILLLPILVIGVFITIISSSCEEDPVESCKQDEFCEAKEVTACCTGDVCVYKFNGKEYPDTDEGVDLLAIDLGCATAFVNQEFKSSENNDSKQITERLRDLMNRVKNSF